VTALPSGKSAEVKRIVAWEGNLEEAYAPLSVTLELDRELDISRGDLIAAASEPAIVATSVKAWMVWMDQRALDVNRRYLVKHASRTVPAVVTSVDYRTNVTTLEREPAATLELNSIGGVSISFLHPIAFDPYRKNRTTGAFILIDPETNGTAGAGMISAALTSASTGQSAEEDDWGPVKAGERQAKWGHRGGVVELSGPAVLIDAVERSLFSVGVVTSRIDAEGEEFLLHPQLLEIITSLQTDAGLLSLVVREKDDVPLRARVEGREVSVEMNEPMKAVATVHQLLQDAAIFIPTEKANL
jgi:hypothetical protein